MVGSGRQSCLASSPRTSACLCYVGHVEAPARVFLCVAGSVVVLGLTV